MEVDEVQVGGGGRSVRGPGITRPILATWPNLRGTIVVCDLIWVKAPGSGYGDGSVVSMPYC